MTSSKIAPSGGFEPAFSWRVIGTPTPVFPGFEVDFLSPVDDSERAEAVWHRERARGMLRAHPEIKELFGNNPWTALWCVGLAIAQVTIALLAAGWSWWTVILFAYVPGAWLNICLFKLATRCSSPRKASAISVGLKLPRSTPTRYIPKPTQLRST